MCSSPNIPPPPPPPQPGKPADTAVLRDAADQRRRASGMAGGTMLTGMNSMASGANMGRATLLGQ